MITINITTRSRNEIIDITHLIEEELKNHKINSGFVYIYSPHTTAGLTINENADPDVKHDILLSLNNIVKENADFKHMEGNSTAHVKTLLTGKSLQIAIENGSLVLGTWDGIMFCEYDGPRHRKVLLKFVQDK